MCEQGSSGETHCGNCGAVIPAGSHFCPECAAPRSVAVTAPAQAVADSLEQVPRVIPVVPVVPSVPVYGAPALRWPCLVMAFLVGLCALVLLLFGCLGMLVAEDIAAEEMGSPFEYRLAALLCGLVPGVLLVVAALFGVFRTFRRPAR